MDDDETEYALYQTVSITIATGATAANQTNIGPTQFGERWKINSFSASGNVNCKLEIVYGNVYNRGAVREVTHRADNDICPTSIELQQGEQLSFWWSNGTPGGQMVCNIQGRRYVKGRRAYR